MDKENRPYKKLEFFEDAQKERDKNKGNDSKGSAGPFGKGPGQRHSLVEEKVEELVAEDEKPKPRKLEFFSDVHSKKIKHGF